MDSPDGGGDDPHRGPFRDGQVHVLSAQCATCIFRPGNLMHLQPGRVAQMVRTATGNDSVIPCHETLGTWPGGPPTAICAGYYHRHGDAVWPLRLARAFGNLVFDPVPEPYSDRR